MKLKSRGFRKFRSSYVLPFLECSSLGIALPEGYGLTWLDGRRSLHEAGNEDIDIKLFLYYRLCNCKFSFILSLYRKSIYENAHAFVDVVVVDDEDDDHDDNV